MIICNLHFLFSNWIICFLLLSFKSSLYVIDVSLVVWKHFLLVFACLFILSGS